MEQPAYCSVCAAPLAQRADGHLYCESCERVTYLDPKLAVAAIVPMKSGIVLVRRGIEPAYGRWSFPSGYVNRGEQVERALEREVEEETGLQVESSWLIGLYSYPGGRVVLGVYQADVAGGRLGAGDETLAASCFALDALPELAVHHDQRIIADWLEGRRLRGL